MAEQTSTPPSDTSLPPQAGPGPGTPAGTAPAIPGAPPAPGPSVQTSPPPSAPTGSSVKLPIGQEFQVAVHHQSIADELGVELKALAFKIETDLKNGWHKLTGWIKDV